MSNKQKSFMAVIGASAGIVTIVFTVGMVPFRAAAMGTRITELEKKVDKQEDVCDDVQYIKGRIDTLCDHILKE